VFASASVAAVNVALIDGSTAVLSLSSRELQEIFDRNVSQQRSLLPRGNKSSNGATLTPGRGFDFS
jgi:hypothetical protein